MIIDRAVLNEKKKKMQDRSTSALRPLEPKVDKSSHNQSRTFSQDTAFQTLKAVELKSVTPEE